MILNVNLKEDTEMIGQSIVHRKPGGQDIIKPMLLDPGTFKLKIQVNKYGALKITKQDEDGNLVPNTSFKVSKNADMCIRDSYYIYRLNSQFFHLLEMAVIVSDSQYSSLHIGM